MALVEMNLAMVNREQRWKNGVNGKNIQLEVKANGTSTDDDDPPAGSHPSPPTSIQQTQRHSTPHRSREPHHGAPGKGRIPAMPANPVAQDQLSRSHGRHQRWSSWGARCRRIA